MAVQLEDPRQEIKRLERCINNLVSLFALPAVWGVSEPSQMVQVLCDALLPMLSLDFVYARLEQPFAAPAEVLRIADWCQLKLQAQDVREMLSDWLGGDEQKSLSPVRNRFGEMDISIFPVPLGIHGKAGMVVAGSSRTDFPDQTESLLLGVAANQGAIGLEGARLLAEQRLVASELDERVGQRTRELAETNDQLRKEIAERKLVDEKLRQEEQELKRSEERWRSVFENSAIGVALTDLNGRFIATNPVYQKMLGYTEEELRQTTFFDITVEEDRDHNWRLVEELLGAKRRQFQIEKQYRRKNGSLVWVRNDVSIVPGGERVGPFLMALSEDITERKRAEEALRNSEQGFRLIVDGIAGLVAIMTATGKVETVNRQVLEYFGKSVEELRFWPATEAVHPDDLAQVISAWSHSVERASPYDVDHRLRGRNGVYRWFHARGLPLRDTGGRAVRWYVLLTDIHERKEAEEKLRQSEADLQEAQRLAQIGSWKLDLSSGKVAVSPEIFRIFEAQPDEDVSSLEFWFDRIHPEDRRRVREHFDKCVAEKLNYEADYRIVLPDGTIKYQHSIGHPILSASGTLLEFLGTAMDVTEQVHARVALQKAFDEIEKSEDQLRAIINTIPTTAWSTRPDGYCDFLNQRWLNYAGMTAEQAHGWGWGAAIHPDDLNGLVEYWQSCLASGLPAETEARMRRFDGAYRWFLFRANPLRDESGKIVRWYGTNVDIDDRKRGEEALRASERNLSLNINAMPTLLASARPDGWGDFFNQRWLDYTGLSAAQLEGWGWASALHPQDAERLLTIWRSSLISGVPLEAEARMLRFDGVYRWLLFRANALRDASGDIIKWYGNAVDIEDRKNAEEKLRRSEAFLAEAQRLSLTGSFSWRVATNEITWSEQLYRIYGFDPGATVTIELVSSRFHPEDIPLMNEMIERVRNSGEDFEYEHRLLMPDRSVKRLQVVGHSSKDGNGQLEYIGTVQDVTQRRLAEEAVAKARTELANMARVKSLGVLTASIAHEVNQPLSGIITNAGTCLRMLSADPPNVDGARETARRAIRDGNRASDVISRLRALFGKKDGAMESVDLNEATREVITLVLSDLRRSRVIVRPELADNLPLVTGDRVQLQQVIMNLVRNASDAMLNVDDRPRDLLIRTERDQDDRVRFSVKDAGVGFGPQAADKLFEAFYTTKNEGMGIGLSVSRSIIEAHHGRLWAEPNRGAGATFSFSIPRGPERATGLDNNRNPQNSAGADAA